MLRQMRLLAEAFAAVGTRIGTRLDVDAAVLEECALLLELLLADGAAHVERHARRPPVLDDIRQDALGHHHRPRPSVALVEVLQLGEIRTEDRVIHTFGIFEVSRILQRSVGVAGRRETGSRLGRTLRRSVLIKALLVL